MPKAKGRDRRLKKGELRQLLAAAKEDELPLVGVIIEFAIETACRRAEIAKLKLKNYDAAAHTLDVLGTKNGDDRRIGLSPRARQILDAIIKERGLTDPDARFFPVHPDEISRAFRRCCRMTVVGGLRVKPIGDRLDFDGLVFHDLRHEGTSNYFDIGLKMHEVAHQTGHRSATSRSSAIRTRKPRASLKSLRRGSRVPSIMRKSFDGNKFPAVPEDWLSAAGL
jgi:integrase